MITDEEDSNSNKKIKLRRNTINKNLNNVI